MRHLILLCVSLCCIHISCKKDTSNTTPDPPPPEDPVEAVPSIDGIQKQLDEKKYAEALEAIEQELTEFPGHSRLLFLKGFALFNLQRFEPALAIFLSLEQKGESSLELTISLSETLFYLQRFDECEKILRDGMKKFPKEAALWYSLGGIHAEKKDWDGARQMYSEALLRNPEFGPALSSLGDLFFLQGNLEKARENFGKLARVKGFEGTAHLKMAMVFMKEKKWGEAMQSLAEAQNIQSDHPELPRLRAALESARLFDTFSGHLNRKECRQAKELFREIQEKIPSHPVLPKAAESLKKACPR